MKKAAIICGIGCGGLAVLSVVGIFGYLFVVGTVGPETSVYTGNRVPARFVNVVKDLQLLDEDEQIRWFYSDALTDIKNGLYFATDDRLVLYSEAWDRPAIVIPLNEIGDITAVYNSSFFEDSTVFVTKHDETEYSFPLSSEKGLDKKFVEWLQKKSGAE